MKIRNTVLALAFAAPLALAAVAQAQAATVTDDVSFSIGGSYGVGSAPWNGAATATGSFEITFDPTKVYSAEPLGTAVQDVVYSVTDSRFGSGSLALGAITGWSYAYGTLDLYTSSVPINQYGSPSKALNDITGLVIGINGWTNPGKQADVWYSKTGFGDTITSSGFNVSITNAPLNPVSSVPLPAALPLFGAAAAGLGAIGWRRRKTA
jgi:hypothetical protein